MISKYLILLLTSGILAFHISPAWEQENTASNLTFVCEGDQGMPITVAKNSKGQKQPIFRWRKKALKNVLNSPSPQDICQKVTTKLNNLSIEGYDLSSVAFTGAQQAGLPIICANLETFFGCDQVLFSFYSTQLPYGVIHDTLAEILDQKILNNKIDDSYRLPDAIYYPAQLFQDEK